MVQRAAEFYAFMRERESIRLKKAAGLPAPWTDDQILRSWKFTNVKREHDRTSRLLREQFYEPHRSRPRPEILFNCALARYFGTIEFALAVGWVRNPVPPDLVRIAAIARSRLNRGERVFTGAYIVTNCGRPGPKEVVVCSFLDSLWRNSGDIIKAANKHHSWEDTASALMKCDGFGGTGFMAKETLLDTLYTDFWHRSGGRPADFNTWTPVGPGSKRGAARVRGSSAKALSGDATLDVCRELFAMRNKLWPQDYVTLDLTDIQFQLCEFSKYEKVRLGEGRPRSTYHSK